MLLGKDIMTGKWFGFADVGVKVDLCFPQRLTMATSDNFETHKKPMDLETSLAPGLKWLRRAAHRGTREAEAYGVISEEEEGPFRNYKKDTATNMTSDKKADASGRGGHVEPELGK